MASHLILGKTGEDFAADYLRRRGYVIVARNRRIPRIGELDLVAREGSTIVFVEVKVRRGPAFDPVFAVDDAKKTKLRRLARAFLRENPAHRHRFDIIGLTLTSDGLIDTIRHIRDAF
jgi:putative endonuclease